MKSSKSQVPSSRETSSPKLQGGNAEGRSLAWWEDGLGDDPFVLKDEPVPDSNARHPFDLEERTARFGEAIVLFGSYEAVISSGGTEKKLHGRLSEVFVKRDGRWVHPGWHLDAR